MIKFNHWNIKLTSKQFYHTQPAEGSTQKLKNVLPTDFVQQEET